jgi:hypothetical protein
MKPSRADAFCARTRKQVYRDDESDDTDNECGCKGLHTSVHLTDGGDVRIFQSIILYSSLNEEIVSRKLGSTSKHGDGSPYLDTSGRVVDNR